MHKFDGLREIVRDPKPFIRKVNETPADYMLLGAFVYMLPWLFSTSAIISAALSYILSALSFFIIGRAVGGKGRFLPVLVSVGYASFPIILLMGVVSVVYFFVPAGALELASAGRAAEIVFSMPLLGALTAFAISFLFLFTWMFLINVIVCRECHSLSAWKSIFVTLVSWAMPIIVSALMGSLP